MLWYVFGIAVCWFLLERAVQDGVTQGTDVAHSSGHGQSRPAWNSSSRRLAGGGFEPPRPMHSSEVAGSTNKWRIASLPHCGRHNWPRRTFCTESWIKQSLIAYMSDGYGRTESDLKMLAEAFPRDRYMQEGRCRSAAPARSSGVHRRNEMRRPVEWHPIEFNIAGELLGINTKPIFFRVRVPWQVRALQHDYDQARDHRLIQSAGMLPGCQVCATALCVWPYYRWSEIPAALAEIMVDSRSLTSRNSGSFHGG